MRGSALTGTVVPAHEVPGLVDEVPVLAVAAACAEGETRFCGVGELRVKESDRLATIASELGAMGARVAVDGDDLVVVGGRLRGADVDSHHDHRIAMAFGVLGALPGNRIEIDGADVADVSFPGFGGLLEDLTAART